MARRVPVQILPGCHGRVSAPELRRIARHVLDAEAAAPQVEVEVVLADAATVRELNRLYRGRDEATDVLSFAVTDAALPDDDDDDALPAPPTLREPVAFVEPPEEAPSIGEVIVCLPVVEAQAAAAGRAIGGEVAHLLVHGLLHLLGHDHEVEADSALMQAREDELLSDLGYAGAYAHGHQD